MRKAIEAGFEANVTMDGNMVHQQNIARFAIAVIALRAKSNRLDDTRPLMNQVPSRFAKLESRHADVYFRVTSSLRFILKEWSSRDVD